MSGICDGRVVLVTGAGRGIGRAHALAFAAEGARVVVNDLGVSLAGEGDRESPAEQVVEEIRSSGGEAVANGSDVADFSQAGALVKTAIDSFGGLDVIVNNAGFVRDRMFVSTSEDEWDAVIRVHLKGHFAVTSNACAYWRGKSKAGDAVDARIINTSSGAGLQGSIGQSAYSAAKAGVMAFTRAVAAEVGPHGIRVNCIAPDLIWNAHLGRIYPDKYFEDLRSRSVTGKAGTPEDMAHIVLFLATDNYLTGQVINGSGGFYMHP